jgi:2-oxo-4-hydroxy-4-carboxy--5-ureidoimidazoline (OHCU) decarboxylase
MLAVVLLDQILRITRVLVVAVQVPLAKTVAPTLRRAVLRAAQAQLLLFQEHPSLMQAAAAQGMAQEILRQQRAALEALAVAVMAVGFLTLQPQEQLIRAVAAVAVVGLP